jgi:uncharacterized protein (TIGR02453 family)
MHTPALLQFLKELSENNNRPWFLHNKPHYDILREEFTELVAAVGAKVREFDPTIGAFDPAKSVFRIYRDVRFSKDKVPYKTHMGAVIGLRNMSDKSRPVHYFHIDHEGTLLIAAGIYMPPPPVLKKIRDYVVAKPKAFEKVLADPGFKKTFGDLADEDRMSRLPKGYAADVPHPDYVRNRNFFCETTLNLNRRVPRDLAGTISKSFQQAAPLMNWLREANR